MVKGKTNKKRLQKLYLYLKKQLKHMSVISSKLQVSDRTQAAIYAMENKLI